MQHESWRIWFSLINYTLISYGLLLERCHSAGRRKLTRVSWFYILFLSLVVIFFLPWLIPRIATLLMARGLVWLLFFLFYVEMSDQKEKKRKSSDVIVMFPSTFFYIHFQWDKLYLYDRSRNKTKQKSEHKTFFFFSFLYIIENNSFAFFIMLEKTTHTRF